MIHGFPTCVWAQVGPARLADRWLLLQFINQLGGVSDRESRDVTTWMELYYLRSREADAERNRTAATTSEITKRLESEQRRHAAALKQLAQIRKLLPAANAAPAKPGM